MKPTTRELFSYLAVALTVGGLMYSSGPQAAPLPPAPTIDTPRVELQALVSPITEKLAGRPAEAKMLAAFYFEASEIIRRDGLNTKIVKTKTHLVTFCERAAILRFQGAFTKVTGLAAAIHGPDGALAKALGLKPGSLDHVKSAEVLHAIAWACQEAGP